MKSQALNQEKNFQETDYDVILIGGGITGLATAAALLHREQFPPSRLLILEKARMIQPIGATLGLFPNGLAALESICPILAQEVISSGVTYRGVVVHDVSSCEEWNQQKEEEEVVRTIASKKEEENGSKNRGNSGGGRGKTKAHVLAWYLLQQALMGTISKACSSSSTTTSPHAASSTETIHSLDQQEALSKILKLGMQFESLSQDPDTGILTISARDRNGDCGAGGDASELWNVTCRVLIGADGIQSKVRDFVLEGRGTDDDDESSATTLQPHPYMFHNRVMYRAILKRDEFDPNIIFPPQGYTLTYRCGKPGKVFAFRENAKDVYSFTSTVLVTEASTATSPRGGGGGGDGIGIGTKKSRLQHHFQDYPPPVQHLIGAVKESAIYENAIYDLNLPTYWSKGSTLMIGDAAHAMSPALGQGGNIGLEDATELAYTLGKLFRKEGDLPNDAQQEVSHTSNHPIDKWEINKALTHFWKRRIERTTMVHELSRRCTEERNRGDRDPTFDRETIYAWKPSFINEYNPRK